MKAYTMNNGATVSSTAVTAVELEQSEANYLVMVVVGSKTYDFYSSTDQSKASTVIAGLISDLGWTVSNATSFGG